jgi:IS30 family transposase
MSKSDQIRELFDRGHSVSEIARKLNTYYSFVYRVVERHIKQKPPTRRKNGLSDAIVGLLKQNMNVNDIMQTLSLPESRRGYVYQQARKYKKGELQ